MATCRLQPEIDATKLHLGCSIENTYDTGQVLNFLAMEIAAEGLVL